MTANIFYYYFSYCTVSVILALIFVWMMHPLSFKVGAVDKGTGRRVHKGIIPRLGGVGIFLAFMIPVLFSLTRGEWDRPHTNMAGILLASTVVFLIGVYDDLKGATIRNKLLAEVLAALIIYAWGIRITTLGNPFGPQFVLGWLSLPVTVLWIIVITNAINLIDGLDGLAAGTGILICLTLFTLSGQDVHLKLAYVILAGGLLGFLRYNFPPASIFMGDSGSLSLGFFLGSSSILSSAKATAIATLMIPILAFSFPLMDMLYAVLRRYYRGLPLGEADKEHIHHKLMAKGLSKKKALLVLYSVNIGIMSLVLLFVRKQRNIDFLGLILIVVIAILGLRLLGYVKFRPLLRDTLQKYGSGRKRRYYDYVITRFRDNASKCKSLDDFKLHLTSLLEDGNFCSAEITLNISDYKNPFYAFQGGAVAGGAFELTIPVSSPDRRLLGEIRLTRLMHQDNLVCTSELIITLSEEVGRFVAENVGIENPSTVLH